MGEVPGTTRIKGGGGVEVELPLQFVQDQVTFPEWGSSDWTSPPDKTQSDLSRALNLSEPLGRPAIHFWMDLLSNVLNAATLANPFALSSTLLYSMKSFGGRSENNTCAPLPEGFHGDGGIRLIYGIDGDIIQAPPVLRHYTYANPFRAILETSTLLAGASTLVRISNIRPLVQEKFPDLLGVFFTLPDNNKSGYDVGIGGAGYHVDLRLPEGTPMLRIRPDRRGGEIMALIGPPGTSIGDMVDQPENASSPYAQLAVPIYVVDTSRDTKPTAIVSDLLGGSTSSSATVAVNSVAQKPHVFDKVTIERLSNARSAIERSANRISVIEKK